MTPSQIEQGTVYAFLLAEDNPKADADLGRLAAEVLSDSGIQVVLDIPKRGGRGAGPAPIDAWIFVALPIAGAIAKSILDGMLNELGSDFWIALKRAVKKLRSGSRPASRASLRISLRGPTGDVLAEFWVHPDDPEAAIDVLEERGFAPVKEQQRVVEAGTSRFREQIHAKVSWSAEERRWKTEVAVDVFLVEPTQ